MPFFGRSARIGVAGLTAWLLSGGCTDEPRAPWYSRPDDGKDAGLVIDAGTTDGPPAVDAPGLCGNLILPAITDKPNLYFVLDRSGSMQETLGETNWTKYKAARQALREVLSALGHRVRYGAALFPMPGGAIEGCSPGKEVFSTRDGDPASYAAAGEIGPVLTSLMVQLGTFGPYGGTPTAATFEVLRPILAALPGRTIVVLATDGAPNCNPDASCSGAECSLTIEQQSIQDQQCTAAFNCCDPALVPGGQLYCVDADETESRIQELALAGIDTYVIGMPGSEYYGALLDRLALAGNTARPEKPFYYPTSSSGELTTALREIGVQVAISCTIALGEAPPDPKLVNVYFDLAVVGYDEVDGWGWVDATTIELFGQACDELQSGDVLQVQVVAGCPSVIR